MAPAYRRTVPAATILISDLAVTDEDALQSRVSAGRPPRRPGVPVPWESYRRATPLVLERAVRALPTVALEITGIGSQDSPDTDQDCMMATAFDSVIGKGHPDG